MLAQESRRSFKRTERLLIMPRAPDQRLLEALLDSWDRNNTILLNLLRVLPEGGLEARAMEGSPSVAQLFTHIHFVRLVFVFEDAPEFARKLPEEEWVVERDPEPHRADAERQRQGRAGRGKEQSGSRPGHEPSLRPPDPPAPAHALARGLPSRSDKVGPQGGGPPNNRRRSRAGHVGRLDAQERSVLGRVHERAQKPHDGHFAGLALSG